MGVWGDQPWDNDDAAEFFSELFSEEFHAKVMAALREDDSPLKWLAAAWVVDRLAHSAYVWCDPAAMHEACHAAADRLEQLAAEDEVDEEYGYGDPEHFRRQAAELRARRHRPLGL